MNEAKIMRMHTPTISVKEIIRCLESRHPNLTGIVKRSTLQRHLFEEGFDAVRFCRNGNRTAEPFSDVTARNTGWSRFREM